MKLAIVLIAAVATVHSSPVQRTGRQGWSTPAPGWSTSTTPGWSTTSGWSSTTPGWSTTSGWSSTTPGWSTTSGWSSTTPGWSTTSTTKGWSSTTPGWAPSPGWSTAGWSSTTPGWSSTTPGWSSTTPGWSSTTPGWSSTTPGWSSTTPAPGWSTTSTTPGWSSTTPGWSTTTQGWSSTTPGWTGSKVGWSTPSTTPGWGTPSTTPGWGTPSTTPGWGTPSTAGWAAPSLTNIDLAGALAAAGSGSAAENHADNVQAIGGGGWGPNAEIVISSSGESVVAQDGAILQVTSQDDQQASSLNNVGVSQIAEASEGQAVDALGVDILNQQSGWAAAQGEGASGADAVSSIQVNPADLGAAKP